MDSFRADLRALDQLDLTKSVLPLPPFPARKTLNQAEKAALKAAFYFKQLFFPVFKSSAGVLQEPILISDKRPSIEILLPQTIQVGMAGGMPGDITLGIGVGVTLMAVIGLSNSFGLYGSTTPELGLFDSIGAGIWSNIGASGGATLTFIFGPPSDFAGISFGIGCDVGAGLIGGNAMLLFSPPPIKFLGFTAGIALGPSLASLDVTVQASETLTKPLLARNR
jgi:hypothetical protein